MKTLLKWSAMAFTAMTALFAVVVFVTWASAADAQQLRCGQYDAITKAPLKGRGI